MASPAIGIRPPSRRPAAEPVSAPQASPNFGARRDGARPSLIVIHYTAMPSCAAARARLCDPEAEVSAHYLISESGAVEALVPEEARAWHAGTGGWGATADVNSHSIGIELANPGDAPFPEPQIAALERLLGEVMARCALLEAEPIGPGLRLAAAGAGRAFGLAGGAGRSRRRLRRFGKRPRLPRDRARRAARRVPAALPPRRHGARGCGRPGARRASCPPLPG